MIGEDCLEFINTFQMQEDHLYYLIRPINQAKNIQTRYRNSESKLKNRETLGLAMFMLHLNCRRESGNMTSHAVEIYFDKD